MNGPNVYEGMLDPVVQFMIPEFRLESINGVRYYKQLLPYPSPTKSTGVGATEETNDICDDQDFASNRNRNGATTHSTDRLSHRQGFRRMPHAV